VKDENGDMLADFCNILNRWTNYYSWLLNVYRANDVRQTEVHTAELFVLGPSPFEVITTTERLKRYK
jgi:hypothetical protein